MTLTFEKLLRGEVALWLFNAGRCGNEETARQNGKGALPHLKPSGALKPGEFLAAAISFSFAATLASFVASFFFTTFRTLPLALLSPRRESSSITSSSLLLLLLLLLSPRRESSSVAAIHAIVNVSKDPSQLWQFRESFLTMQFKGWQEREAGSRGRNVSNESQINEE